MKLATAALTLVDWAKRIDPDGKTSVIVEMLSEENEILEDMLWLEGNLATGHRNTIRTGLPSVYWRLLNQGTPTSKSSSAQVDEACGMLEARSQVDVDLASLNANLATFRLSESRAFLEAMSQEMAATVFYGNSSAAPQEFNGLSVRYSSLSAANGQNIVDGGGTGSDNSSIWLVGWGEKSVTGIFPKGSKAGLEHQDLGKLEVLDENRSEYQAYKDLYKWKAGLNLKDWRYTVRIPNIDVSNLVAKNSAADLVELMIKAIHRFPSIKSVKPVFYMNRSLFQMLDIQRRDDVQVGGQLKYEFVDGKSISSFRNVPVKICDVLSEAEDRVT